MPRKRPNEHWLEGDTMHIRLAGGKEALIDAEDWPLVCQLRWHVGYQGQNRRAKTVSGVEHTENLHDGHWRSTKLHHLLVGKPQDGHVVNHVNGNPLDNRRTNLEVLTSRQNCQHKDNTGARNNTSGCRGVHRVPCYDRYYWRFRCSNCVAKTFPYTDEGYQQAVAFAHEHWEQVHPDCPGYEPEKEEAARHVA